MYVQCGYVSDITSTVVDIGVCRMYTYQGSRVYHGDVSQGRIASLYPNETCSHLSRAVPSRLVNSPRCYFLPEAYSNLASSIQTLPGSQSRRGSHRRGWHLRLMGLPPILQGPIDWDGMRIGQVRTYY